MSASRAITKTSIVIIIVAIIVISGVALGAYYVSVPTAPPPTPTPTRTPIPTPSVVSIGASLSLSGPFAAFGKDQLLAYSYAINQTNAKGGIYFSKTNSYAKIKFVYYDDASDPSKATNNIQRLISLDHIDALLGGYGSTLVIAEARTAQSNNVVMVTPGSADEIYDKEKYTRVFLPFLNISGQSITFYQFLTGLPIDQRATKVAIWAEATKLGADSAVDWKARFSQNGFQVVYEATYQPGTKDYSSLILGAKQAGAQMVFAIPTPPDAVAIVQQMRDLDYTPWLLNMQRAAETPFFAKALGPLANGILNSDDWAPSLNTPGNRELVDFYVKATGGQPGLHFGSQYAAAQVLLAAIQMAGTTDKDALTPTLATGVFQTVLGPVSFPRGFGHGNVNLYLVQWQNGTLQVVWPSQFATARIIYPLKRP